MIRDRPLILLAEDEPLEQRMLQTLLSDQGYATIVAESGQQAIVQAIRHRPDLVVLDLYLPDMTGMAALREIRAFGALARIRIIVLSGYVEAEISRQARRAGADAVISKGPSPTGELLREIRKFLPLRSVAKPSVSATPAAPAVLAPPASRGILPRGAAGKMLGRFLELRPLPLLAEEILKASTDPRSDVKKFAGILSQEKTLAARILTLAHSAFPSSSPAAARGPMQNLGREVARLGIPGVRDPALALLLVDQHRKASGAGADVTLDRAALWRHSLACAVLARDLAAASGGDAARTRTLFLAGLLHDAGKAVLDDVLPEEYPPVLARAAKDGIPLHVAEQEAFGIDHAEASRQLLIRWQLPGPVVEAVGLHHMPVKDLLKKSGEILSVVGLLQVADALVKASLTCDSGERILAEAPHALALAGRLGLDAEKIRTVLGHLDLQVQNLTLAMRLHDEAAVPTDPVSPSDKAAKTKIPRGLPAGGRLKRAR